MPTRNNQLRKHAKARYKYAVRRVMGNQDKLRRAKLANALCHGNLGIFAFREVTEKGPAFMCCLFSAHLVSDATVEGELEWCPI